MNKTQLFTMGLVDPAPVNVAGFNTATVRWDRNVLLEVKTFLHQGALEIMLTKCDHHAVFAHLTVVKFGTTTSQS